MTKSFIVNSKDVFDKKKNPNLKLSVKVILKNKKIKKIRWTKEIDLSTGKSKKVKIYEGRHF